MLAILGEKIHDERFLRLVGGMLTAGYLEDWNWGATLSGVPQGGVASPILASPLVTRQDTNPNCTAMTANQSPAQKSDFFHVRNPPTTDPTRNINHHHPQVCAICYDTAADSVSPVSPGELRFGN